ncbi:hypothetical protein CROQUDRAFT_651301 [Cronartium quercuum f. sp. fusiforme G11]|uniref:Autophagy-related protein 14 n=1 Tax=Cronartium quercuum f. sp. fusiforme G11 TaxID=708437 RepID=A0A9P6NW73_9BASI|nr:hypothetical protein CROQUDRAFT_651301 [Cronartium quercuum f. sp. fusiforme G11]
MNVRSITEIESILIRNVWIEFEFEFELIIQKIRNHLIDSFVSLTLPNQINPLMISNIQKHSINPSFDLDLSSLNRSRLHPQSPFLNHPRFLNRNRKLIINLYTRLTYYHHHQFTPTLSWTLDLDRPNTLVYLGKAHPESVIHPSDVGSDKPNELFIKVQDDLYLFKPDQVEMETDPKPGLEGLGKNNQNLIISPVDGYISDHRKEISSGVVGFAYDQLEETSLATLNVDEGYGPDQKTKTGLLDLRANEDPIEDELVTSSLTSTLNNASVEHQTDISPTPTSKLNGDGLDHETKNMPLTSRLDRNSFNHQTETSSLPLTSHLDEHVFDQHTSLDPRVDDDEKTTDSSSIKFPFFTSSPIDRHPYLSSVEQSELDRGHVKSFGVQDLINLVERQLELDEVKLSMLEIERNLDKWFSTDLRESCAFNLARRLDGIKHHIEILKERDNKAQAKLKLVQAELKNRREQLKLKRERYESSRTKLTKSLLPSLKNLKEIYRNKLLPKVKSTTRSLSISRAELISQLNLIYPIELNNNTIPLNFSISGLVLPLSIERNSFLLSKSNEDERKHSTALGFIGHLTTLLARYLSIPILYPITFIGSRSLISDPISLLKGPQTFPLFYKGVDRFRFEYGVFLLNKDIEQIMYHRHLTVTDIRHTLANLKNLLLTLEVEEEVEERVGREILVEENDIRRRSRESSRSIKTIRANTEEG